jgi:histidinol-phosphate/aromatic aminotransferase/cobyric acid decarboxylase-like protein
MQGKRIVIPQPTFGEYPRIFPEADTYPDAVGIDTKEIEKRSAGCDVVVFVNPNNPTGSLIKPEWIHAFAGRNKEKTIVVDESFVEFSQSTSMMALLETQPFDNVIVIKSLSKSLGIPGVRLGYVYSCNGAFNDAVKEYIPIWNLNSLAECFLEVILKHRKSMQNSFTDTIRDRNAFAQALSEVPIVKKVHPSAANFLLVSLDNHGLSGGEVADMLLKKHDIYIRDISPKFSDGNTYIRLAVRMPEENNRLVSCLKEL